MAGDAAKATGSDWLENSNNYLNNAAQTMAQIKNPNQKADFLAGTMYSELKDAKHIARAQQLSLPGVDPTAMCKGLADQAWNQAMDIGTQMWQGLTGLFGFGQIQKKIAKHYLGQEIQNKIKFAQEARKQLIKLGQAKSTLDVVGDLGNALGQAKSTNAGDVWNSVTGAPVRAWNYAKGAVDQGYQQTTGAFRKAGDIYNQGKQCLGDPGKCAQDAAMKMFNDCMQGGANQMMHRASGAVNKAFNLAEIRNPNMKLRVLSQAIVSNLSQAHYLAQASGWYKKDATSLANA